MKPVRMVLLLAGLIVASGALCLVTGCTSGRPANPRTAPAGGSRVSGSPRDAQKPTARARTAEKDRATPSASKSGPASSGNVWIDRAQAIEAEACACQDRECAKHSQQMLNDYIRDAKGVKVKKDASKLIARAVLKALSCIMKIRLKKSP